MADEMYVGADIGGTHLRTALVDREGKILRQRKTATDIRHGSRQASDRLISACRELMGEASSHGGRVAAVGLGVAGKIDRLKGKVIFSPNLPAMRDYPLASELENALEIPVVMENDANVFGIGEGWAGSGRGVDNWIGLTLGTGVGGCLIFRGELWNGDDLGFVAETGHLVVDPAGPKCACGLRGCLEAHSSGRALMEGVEEAVAAGVLTGGPLFDRFKARTLDAEAVYDAAKEGDPAAGKLFHRMGWGLGLAIAGLFTVLGISNAIIGGGVSGGWDLFIEPLRKTLAEYSPFLSLDLMRIQRSALGDDAALVGAARLAWKHEESLKG